MRSFLKWMFRLLIAAMAVAIVIPVVGSFLLAKQDIKSTLSDLVYESTGRQLQIDGELGLTPGLKLKIHADGVRYENAKWASRESAFTADRVEVELSVTELLRGKFVVQEATVLGAELWIERDTTGSFNLVNSGPGSRKGRASINLPDWLELRAANVLDSKIVYLHERLDWEILLDDVKFSSEDKDNPIAVQADGKLQGIDVSISGLLGSIRTLFARSASIVDLQATLARTGQLSAQGRIDDVIGWRGIDVALNASIDQLRHLSKLFYAQPVDASSIVANARFFQPETVGSMQLRGVDCNFWLWGVSMNLNGKISKLSRLEKIDVQVTADSDFKIGRINPAWRFGSPVRARFDASLIGESDDLTLEISQASLNTRYLAVIADASTVGDITGNWQQPLSVQMQLSDLSEFGGLFDQKLPRVGEISGRADLWRTDGGFSLEEILITNREAPITLIGKGHLRQIGQEQQGRLSISGQASREFYQDNLFVLPLYPILPLLPEASKVKAELIVDGIEGRVDIESAEMFGPGYFTTGSGQIPDLFQPSVLTLNIEGEVNNETELGTALGVQLPKVGPVSIDAKLVGAGENVWNLEDLVAQSTTESGYLAARGEIEKLGAEARADIFFTLKTSAAEMIESIPGLSGLEQLQGELENTQVSGTLLSETRLSWSINDLVVSSTWNGVAVNVAGNVDTLAPVSGRLDVNITGEFEQNPEIVRRFELPQLEQVEASFTVPLPMDDGVQNINILLSGSEAEAKLIATQLQPFPLKTEWLRVAVTAEDFANLIPFEHAIAPGSKLVANLDMRIDPEELSATGSVRIGDSDMEGKIVWAQGEDERPVLLVVANAERLDFKTLFATKEKQDKVFSSDSLMPQWMQRIDGKIDLKAKTFRNNLIELQDLNVTINFDRGEMRIDFGEFNESSFLEGMARIQPVGQSEIKVKAKDVPMESLLSFSEEGLFEGGTFDADINLKGLGSSLAELLETGTGEVELDLYRSGIQNKDLETVGADLLSNVVAVVNPFSDRDDFVAVECGVIHFDINNGVATTRNGLALKTDRVTVLGGGKITFPKEAVELVIAPKPRHGIGISATTIAKMVRVGGTLSNPEIEADAKGFLKSGAAIGAAIFSGGLTLVAQGLLDRLTANSEVCKIARGLISLEQEKQEDETKSR
ncbi:MAG: AsmA family protein [bacterium]